MKILQKLSLYYHQISSNTHLISYAGIYYKYHEVMPPKDADGMENMQILEEQSDLGLHCIPRLILKKTNLTTCEQTCPEQGSNPQL